MPYNDLTVSEQVFPADSAEATPHGQRTNAIRWLQKRVAERTRLLPHEFASLEEWEAFRSYLRAELPRVIGIPHFPPLQESLVRGRIQVGNCTLCERVDVYVDADYAIPTFVFLPVRLTPNR